ncbi:hypothetical protein [Muriicola sp. Z0-33]|uniref:hypothetical protein n=1 Tax=Muriicola sp. Z0-33 TaxID=2816957 RepID=UPI0022389A99|nr:hypothetical protein [Muriicola sp. Z0-33]
MQQAQVLIKAQLAKTILEKNTEGKLVCYQLTDLSFTLKSGGISMDTEFISKDLKQPVFVQINDSGKIGHIYFDSSLSNMATGVFKDIIGRMQFVQPAKKSKSWQTVEENNNGTYMANYRMAKSGSSAVTYNKEIVKYLAYKSKRKNQSIDIDNATTIETDNDGAINKINTSEAQIVLYQTDTISASGTKVAVLLRSKTKIKNNIKEHLLTIKNSDNYSIQTTLSAPVSTKNITKMVHAGTLGTDNWQQLFQRLSTAHDLTKEQEVSLIEKFRAVFYLYPDTCKQVGGILEREPFNSIISRVLRTALSTAETSEATDAIADIISRNHNNEQLLEELLTELTTTAFPTKNAIETVKAIAFKAKEPQDDFIRSTAQLTLGGMAYRIKAIDSVQADELTSFLLKEMRTEKDTIQQLFVLGNTGSPIVYPFIKSLIEHSQTSDQIKIEAIYSLSLIKNSQVSGYLEKLAQNNKATIRETAREVIKSRSNEFDAPKIN